MCLADSVVAPVMGGVQFDQQTGWLTTFGGLQEAKLLSTCNLKASVMLLEAFLALDEMHLTETARPSGYITPVKPWLLGSGTYRALDNRAGRYWHENCRYGARGALGMTALSGSD